MELIERARIDYAKLVEMVSSNPGTFETLGCRLNGSIIDDCNVDKFRYHYGVICATLYKSNDVLNVSPNVEIWDDEDNMLFEDYDMSPQSASDIVDCKIKELLEICGVSDAENTIEICKIKNSLACFIGRLKNEL